MFGIGPGELLLIFLIALFVLGPERLPSAARDIGKAMNELRKVSDELTQEFLNADRATPASPAPPAIETTARASEPAPTAPAPAEAASAEPASAEPTGADHAGAVPPAKGA